ncbi:MAG: DsrE/DsrF/DrsH-like family protein [Actinobacteria bacterium]|nr:DsrE/DsrF/DrsH-like family protein [Actinomycetota bacterium]MBU1944370.1 DsrE/DsrF/DrsH-like family protein [Actinomycetota bacterium]MBU2688169.1 DsrE/DsrF/DrsH-like family protein [Actinomycetota bacterium]
MPDENAESMTLIVFSDALDRALAAFNLANTGAAMGMRVDIFFTFWGLSVIKKGGMERGERSFMQWMMGLMKRGTPGRLKLSEMNMMGLGTGAMKGLMKKYRMPSLEESMALAREQGVRYIACTTSMAMMGLTEDDFIEVDEYAGAATYLSLASKGSVNLFI